MNLSVCYCVCLSVHLRAHRPVCTSVPLPSCPFVCFDLHHSTWSPGSSVPFPNSPMHPPRCTPPFASLHASDTQRLLWASAAIKKDSVLYSAPIIRDKEIRSALALADFRAFPPRTPVETHMKEIIRSIPLHLFRPPRKNVQSHFKLSKHYSTYCV